MKKLFLSVPVFLLFASGLYAQDAKDVKEGAKIRNYVVTNGGMVATGTDGTKIYASFGQYLVSKALTSTEGKLGSGFLARFSVNAVTGIEEFLPENTPLAQNFPNPFSETTRIPFSVDNTGKVEVKVFTTTSVQVRILLSEFLDTGNYTVNFDAHGLPDGAYLVQININNTISQRIVTLMR